VGSARDLEREFQTIMSHFQGKETEDNWALREKDFHKIRSIIRGEAISHYKDTFVTCITKLLDAITESVHYHCFCLLLSFEIYNLLTIVYPYVK
jgi:hypothetical protein